MKRRRNSVQFLVLLVCISLLCIHLTGCGSMTEPVSATASNPEVESICLDTLTALPDPFTWFGQGEKWVAEAGTYCGLSFEEYPADAVEAYVLLLEGEYGLQRLSHKEYLPGDISLGDGQTGEEALRITWAKQDGHMTGFLIFEFADGYTTVPGAIWNGDLSDYEWAENHWQDCTTCRGSGQCAHCDGTGFVREVDLEGFTRQTDCDRCLTGQCPEPDCRDGRIQTDG